MKAIIFNYISVKLFFVSLLLRISMQLSTGKSQISGKFTLPLCKKLYRLRNCTSGAKGIFILILMRLIETRSIEAIDHGLTKA